MPVVHFDAIDVDMVSSIVPKSSCCPIPPPICFLLGPIWCYSSFDKRELNGIVNAPELYWDGDLIYFYPKGALP